MIELVEESVLEQQIVSEPLQFQEISAFSFSNWFKTYEKYMSPAKIIALDQANFNEFISSDGIYLPDATIQPKYNMSYIEEISSDSDWDSDLSGEEEEHNNQNDETQSSNDSGPAHKSFKKQKIRAEFDAGRFELINEAISELGGKVIPRMNWSAPTDAIWISIGQSLECESASQVLLLLKASDKVANDISGYGGYSDPFGVSGISTGEQDGASNTSVGAADVQKLELVLRKYKNYVPSMIFRVFVKNSKIVAISQVDMNYYDFLFDQKHLIEKDIVSFFDKSKLYEFQVANFCFDVYVEHPKGTGKYVELLDIDPWYPASVDASIVASTDCSCNVSDGQGPLESSDKVSKTLYVKYPENNPEFYRTLLKQVKGLEMTFPYDKAVETRSDTGNQAESQTTPNTSEFSESRALETGSTDIYTSQGINFVKPIDDSDVTLHLRSVSTVEDSKNNILKPQQGVIENSQNIGQITTSTQIKPSLTENTRVQNKVEARIASGTSNNDENKSELEVNEEVKKFCLLGLVSHVNKIRSCRKAYLTKVSAQYNQLINLKQQIRKERRYNLQALSQIKALVDGDSFEYETMETCIQGQEQEFKGSGNHISTRAQFVNQLITSEKLALFRVAEAAMNVLSRIQQIETTSSTIHQNTIISLLGTIEGAWFGYISRTQL
ncbi:hypothetical protein BB560_002897 [Smittium megazygosporum]|uniref:Cell division cycle protein 123 n=1 Tax=Smittium megazygosporum TaxID=133381 RepID=A0A2T9ZDJ3_9FUNG|nr:hypothetical protein BB560_002897 [Smittium megazygosporum]